MEPTLPLSGAAKSFWGRHAKRLQKAKVLTDSDLDSFTVLCVTFGMIDRLKEVEPGADAYREMVQFCNLLKQYQALAKQFGLLPRERKQAKMSTEPEAEKDEFNL